jgi:hypothetical protein
MRQIFSVRFFAAVGAVVGLFFLLTTIFATSEAIDGGGGGETTTTALHKVDFVDQVSSVSNARFRIGADGLTDGDTDLVIDASRAVRVAAGTPGEILCPGLRRPGACAVVADLLGEAVVWFALVPMGSNNTVRLPAIDTLEAGTATLVNGWQVPFAPVLDRRCEDEFVSYRDFRETFGDNFTSIYDIEDRRLSAVECQVKVPYAPEPTTTTSTTTATDPTPGSTTAASTP